MDAQIIPDADQAQVRVTFTTLDEEIQLPESKRQLLVPADIRRYGLSRILNSESMLSTSTAIPFDFLINGSFLRSTLEDYLRNNGLSAETNITLQYVRSLIPPIYEASFEHDDWVSAVDVLSSTSPAGRWSGSTLAPSQDRILSASYDGLLRIWNGSGHVLATSAGASGGGHSTSIKSARFLSATQLASSSMDRTVRVWKYTESDDRLSGALKPTLELYGHKGSIDALDVDGPSKRILTASADGAIALWAASKSSAPEAPANLLPGAQLAGSNKRRKIAAKPSVSAPQRGALGLWNVHTAPATAAIFDPSDRTVGFSTSLDHTLRTLDLTTGRVVNTLTTPNPLLALCALRQAPGAGAATGLLAVGTSARNVSLIDPRVSSATTSVMTLRGHVNKVVAVAPSPEDAHALVSGSHDGTCRIWDLRSVRAPGAGGEEGEIGGSVGGEAVYVVERESRAGKKRAVAGEGCKVFGVVWDKTWGIVSGGEDKRVQVNRGRDIIAK